MLEDLKKDIEKLIALYEKEQAGRKRLESELAQSKADNTACRKQIEELQQEVENLHLIDAFKSPGEGNSQAKEKVDRLIREIDKCIAMLEN